MDVATVEHCRRPAEDEVHRAFDVAIFVVLTATLPVGVERILKAEETAVLEAGTVGTDEACHRLPHGSGTVRERDVFCVEIRRIDITGS